MLQQNAAGAQKSQPKLRAVGQILLWTWIESDWFRLVLVRNDQKSISRDELYQLWLKLSMLLVISVGALRLQQHSKGNFLEHPVFCIDCTCSLLWWLPTLRFRRCSANPCKKGETQARSRQCLDRLETFLTLNLSTLPSLIERKAGSTFSFLLLVFCVLTLFTSWGHWGGGVAILYFVSCILILFTSQGHWGGGLPKLLLWTGAT